MTEQDGLLDAHGRHRSGAVPAGAAATRPPVDASMGLLHDLMYRQGDADYTQAAHLPPPATHGGRARRTVLHMAIAVVLGVVTVTAISSLRAPQPSELESRSLLEAQIADRSAEADELQLSNEALAGTIAELQSDALAAADPELFAELQKSELLSGAVAVTGPGLLIEIDDAPADEGIEQEPGSRVQDLDLQIVTNGLWASGAEAVAINGQRLTSLSAIRAVGPAILVDLAPLIPPYRVEAVGDVRNMQTAFARSSAANHLALLTGTYGITVSTRAQTELTLPGTGNTTLLYASPLGSDVASSLPPQQEGSP